MAERFLFRDFDVKNSRKTRKYVLYRLNLAILLSLKSGTIQYCYKVLTFCGYRIPWILVMINRKLVTSGLHAKSITDTGSLKELKIFEIFLNYNQNSSFWKIFNPNPPINHLNLKQFSWSTSISEDDDIHLLHFFLKHSFFSAIFCIFLTDTTSSQISQLFSDDDVISHRTSNSFLLVISSELSHQLLSTSATSFWLHSCSLDFFY